MCEASMSKGDATRSRILDAAMQLASRDGLDGLTIGALSGALSLSKSGLFAHFGSKEALQLAVLEHARARFAAHLEPRMREVAPGLPSLRAFMHAWLDWIASSHLPAGCPILGATFELEARHGPPRDFLVRLHGDARARLTSFIDAAQVAGQLAPGIDVAQLVFELRGIALAFHEELHVMRGQQARAHADRALAGLVQRHAPATPPNRRRARRP
jgi:AcrR family transcriptional regulator